MMNRVKSRLDAFQLLYKHPWYHKQVRKLSADEIDFCMNFIVDANDLDPLEFEYKANRAFLDKEKPKNFALINELLVAISKGS